jgi:hypothetical protein
MNFNIVEKVRGTSECARIRDTFAPKPAAQRLLYRTALRLWINATNPRWLVRKRQAWNVAGLSKNEPTIEIREG